MYVVIEGHKTVGKMSITPEQMYMELSLKDLNFLGL